MKTYQPIFKDDALIQLLRSKAYASIPNLLQRVEFPYERVCIDRLLAIVMDLELLEINQGTVLDIGCNIGLFSHGLAAIGFNVTGIDNNAAPDLQEYYPEPCLKTANRLKTVFGTNPDFVETDIEPYILNNNREFDVVLLLNVVHHFFEGYAKSGIGKKSHDKIFMLLRILCSRIRRVLYFEGPENEDIAYYPEGILFPDWFKDQAGACKIKAIAKTIGANGMIRNLYRIQFY